MKTTCSVSPDLVHDLAFSQSRQFIPWRTERVRASIKAGLHFDPWLHFTVVWLDKRAFLVSVMTSVHTHCAIYQNIAPVSYEYFLT